MWVRQLPLDSGEQYTAILGVKEADPLDQGTYTCQVSDWGYQQCKSVVLNVLQAPRIRIDPMTVTVEKVRWIDKHAKMKIEYNIIKTIFPQAPTTFGFSVGVKWILVYT